MKTDFRSGLFHGCLILMCMYAVIGCASYQEPEAQDDATPPPGYAPVFVSRIAPAPDKKTASASVTVTRVDTRDPKIMRVYAHIVDTDGTFFSGASKKNAKLQWCKVSEVLDGAQKEIKNFTVRELSETDPEPVAAAIVMDNSGSMGNTRAIAMQAAVADFISVKRPQDALALVRYDHTTLVECPLTADAAVLRSTLKQNGLEGFGGGTAIHSGIATAIEHLNSQSGTQRKAVIVFTDGQENSSKVSRDAMIALALKSNIVVCAVDFGAGINEGYMEGIARSTGGSYAHIYRTNEFRPMFEDVYRRIRNSYIIEYPVQGYGDHILNVRLCWGKDTLATSTVYNNTPDVGAIALLNVTFDHGKSTLNQESASAINNIVLLLRAFPNMTIEVRGHTDNSNSTNDPDFNKKLSQRRAETVRDAIVKAGINGQRITVNGFGDAMPVADNKDEAGRAMNRRTEFKILTR